MRWFRNMRTLTKLMVGFGLVVAVLIVEGAIGLRNMGRINDELNDLYEEWVGHFSLCPVLSVPADDLDYVAHPRHLDLIAQKIEEKLTGKEEVVFEANEVNGV